MKQQQPVMERLNPCSVAEARQRHQQTERTLSHTEQPSCTGKCEGGQRTLGTVVSVGPALTSELLEDTHTSGDAVSWTVLIGVNE